jgi:hypothetical protein
MYPHICIGPMYSRESSNPVSPSLSTRPGLEFRSDSKVCMYISMHMYIYMRIYMYIKYVYIHVYNMYMYIYIYEGLSMYLSIHIYTCIPALYQTLPRVSERL